MAPDNGGIEMAVVDVAVSVRSEGTQVEVAGQVDGHVQMQVDVAVVLVLFHLQQRVGIVDPYGLRNLYVAAVVVGAFGHGGVEGGSRVEQLLLEGQHVVLLDGAEDAQVYFQAVVECLVADVELGEVAAVFIVTNHRLVLHYAH